MKSFLLFLVNIIFTINFITIWACHDQEKAQIKNGGQIASNRFYKSNKVIHFLDHFSEATKCSLRKRPSQQEASLSNYFKKLPIQREQFEKKSGAWVISDQQPKRSGTQLAMDLKGFREKAEKQEEPQQFMAIYDRENEKTLFFCENSPVAPDQEVLLQNQKILPTNFVLEAEVLFKKLSVLKVGLALDSSNGYQYRLALDPVGEVLFYEKTNPEPIATFTINSIQNADIWNSIKIMYWEGKGLFLWVNEKFLGQISLSDSLAGGKSGLFREGGEDASFRFFSISEINFLKWADFLKVTSHKNLLDFITEKAPEYPINPILNNGLEFGNDTRRAILLPSPSQLSFSLVVPLSGGSLRLSSGIYSKDNFKIGESCFLIKIKGKQKTNLDFSPEALNTWHESRINLNDFAGQKVQIQIEISNKDQSDFPTLALLAEPAFYPSDLEDEPNLILISLDTLRADYLGCYGHYPSPSPVIDSLVIGKGLLFENVMAQASWTLPSHASMLTSLYPHKAGVAGANCKLDPNSTMLSGLLYKNDYELYGFTGDGWIDAHFGFNHYFDSYFGKDCPFAELMDRVETFLKQAERSKFFLFLHTYDIHNYYRGLKDEFKAWEDIDPPRKIPKLDIFPILDPPRELLNLSSEQMNYMKWLYEARIYYVDTQIARLVKILQEKNLLNKTIIVITSDHGEGFDLSNLRFHHGGRLHDDLLHVPLVFYGSTLFDKNHLLKDAVALVDLIPTLKDLLGLDGELDSDGISLKPIITSSNKITDHKIFAEESTFRVDEHGQRKTLSGEVIAAVRQNNSGQTASIKIIRYIDKNLEIYNLDQDPEELNNQAINNQAPENLEQADQDLNNFISQAISPNKSAFKKEEIPKDVEDKLRALGYIE